MPDVITQTKIVDVPAELTVPQPVPVVPDHGDIGHLLDWAEQCASTAQNCNDQITRIRGLNHD